MIRGRGVAERCAISVDETPITSNGNDDQPAWSSIRWWLEATQLIADLRQAQILSGQPERKTVRETEAEAVAFIVGTAVGLASSVSSRVYIGL